MRPIDQMTTAALLGLCAFAAAGCQQAPADDDSGADDDSAEDATPAPTFDSMSGTITYTKEYTGGPLEGQSCTEIFNIAGPNVTETQPNDCTTCDQVFQFYLTVQDDACAGGEDLEDTGLIGFDLRPTAEEAVAWFFAEGWFGSDWTELTTGTLLHDQFDGTFDDPDNGSWTANWTTEDPCSWGSICQWNGHYALSFDLSTEDAQ